MAGQRDDEADSRCRDRAILPHLLPHLPTTGTIPVQVLPSNGNPTAPASFRILMQVWRFLRGMGRVRAGMPQVGERRHSLTPSVPSAMHCLMTFSMICELT